MTIRKLPDIQNFVEPEGFESTPSIEAIDQWAPDLRIKAEASAAGATVIEIFDQIGKDPYTGEGIGAQDVADQLKGAKDVIVNINSLGGSFFQGVTIFNLLKRHAYKVNVNVLGVAASAASIVAMSGDVINMGPAAFMMIHNGQGITMGDRHEHANSVERLTAIDAAIRDLYVARTGKHGNSISQMMDAETTMNAADCIKHGFADAMIAKGEIFNDASVAAAAHPLHAKRMADAIFAQHGLTRARRRSMFAAIKAGPNDPGFVDAQAAMSALRLEMTGLRDALRALKPEVEAAMGWMCGASSDLPIDMSAPWDGPAAAQRVLDACNFDSDSPNMAKAKKAFLFHDMSAPDMRGSYKDPFADMVGGELKAVRGGVRAAASRLSQTDDIPAAVRDQAKRVVAHYEERFSAADSAGGTQNAANEATQDAVLREIADDLRTILKPAA